MKKKDFAFWTLFLSFFVLLGVVCLHGGSVLAQEESGSGSQASSVLATSDGDFPGVRVEVLELKRTGGETVTLKFAIVNESDKSINFGHSFGDESRAIVDYRSIGGVYLIDASGKKKYHVVRDAEGKCLCSRGLGKIEPGSRMNLWAKFPAPPDSVEKITVVIPHFIPMDDVPISK